MSGWVVFGKPARTKVIDAAEKFESSHYPDRGIVLSFKGDSLAHRIIGAARKTGTGAEPEQIVPGFLTRPGPNCRPLSEAVTDKGFETRWPED
jgi:hypothetical protein